jgi:hypothetical protein
MTIIDEARASVALDHDEHCGTQSGRESALAHLTKAAHLLYPWEVRIYEDGSGNFWCQVGNPCQLQHTGYGATPADAIANCARAAGWPG